MDTIEFRLTYFQYGADDFSSSVADIFINGENLLPIIHEFEESVGCNGGHAPIFVKELYKNLSEDYKTGSIPIFGCDCGVTDCSAIYISVEINAETVIWKNFILPDENLRCELIYPRRFGEFIFDKAQYFREIEKLKLWSEDDSLSIEYGGVEGGEIQIIVKKNVQTFEFYFDELLDDPLPDFVKFFNAIRGGEDYFSVYIVRDDGHVAFKLSIKRWLDGQVCFYVELVGENLIFSECLPREKLAAMFKKIFDALLNDKYFPYSYPCYGNIHEEDNLYDELIDEAEKYPNWSFGDVLNHAAETGQLKLAPPYEKYLEHYRKMLTEFIVPEKWFE